MAPVARPLAAGAATVAAYLAVVVLTTPALPAGAAVSAALELNSVVILGMGVGVGLQVHISESGRRLGCRMGRGRAGASSGGTAATSFFSFFSLVPLGCCGWWLYLLSLLPSVLGSGFSAVLIEHSQSLSYLGLAAIYAFVAIRAYRLATEKRVMRMRSRAQGERPFG